MTLAIWRSAVEECEAGRDFVMATILGVRGSSPRHVGTRFLVRGDGSTVGTIGGGLFEAQVLEFAKAVLGEGSSRRAHFSFLGANAESPDMICGGDAEVLVEYVDTKDQVNREIYRRLLSITKARGQAFLLTDLSFPPDASGSVSHLLLEPGGERTGGFPGDENAVRAMPPTRILEPARMIDTVELDHPVFLEWFRPRGTAYVFGAGHVGQCVAHMASYVDFRVVVIDDRPEFASQEKVPDADEVLAVESFDGTLGGLGIDEESYIVIVTRGHAHDRSVLGQALRTDAGYIGMIGSRRKINLIYKALLEQGLTREDLERVHAPVGLPIGGETPQEIAVSIIAEMIQIRNRKDKLKSLT